MEEDPTFTSNIVVPCNHKCAGQGILFGLYTYTLSPHVFFLKIKSPICNFEKNSE